MDEAQQKLRRSDKENDVGEVRTEITLVNVREAGYAQGGFIPESQVKRLTVNAVVDTGAWTLVINEETRQKLGLLAEETSEATVAGGAVVPCRITEPVGIRWKNRHTVCEAAVIPDEADVLLGAFPLQGMDLMVHPKKQEVVGAHGPDVRYVIK
ncbi:MAG: aspartyl protease family protein [Treponema sp.]|jgi:clan AA aspartic protease|nr:aspartyl protease family protein [Treponema sp.]